MADESDPQARIDELFALPPEDFTAARNALARELRAAGHRDTAAEVGKLRRPTVAAWAVNQTVRRHRKQFEQLLAAGDDVRREQRRALSGVRGAAVRDAGRARRSRIDELTDAAAAILAEHGVASDTHRGDIAATFDAASADEEAAATVSAGRLSQALPLSAGFGEVDGLMVFAPIEPDAEQGEDEDTEQVDEQAAVERRNAIRAVEDARRRLADATSTAERAEADAAKAARKAESADDAAQAAELKARRLRDEADEAAARAEQLRTRAGDARQDADALADELHEHEEALQRLDT